MVKGSLKTDMPAILVRVLAESACVARDGGQRGAGKQAGRQAGRQVRVLDERACAFVGRDQGRAGRRPKPLCHLHMIK
jgi:hypothetical protein